MEEEEPKNASLEEVVGRLGGLNIDLSDIPELKGIPFDEKYVRDRRITFERYWMSLLFPQDGHMKIRIKGTYVEEPLEKEYARQQEINPMRIPFDYVPNIGGGN